MNDSFVPAGKGNGIKTFDFSTAQKVQLTVQFGSKVGGEVICLYPSPVTSTTLHQRTDMLYSSYLDSKGKLSTVVTLPRNLDRVFLFSASKPEMGCIEALIRNGKLIYDENDLPFVMPETRGPLLGGTTSVYEEDWHIIGTYAFEDLWPNHCDFDLNDVIVEHWQKITYTSQNTVRTISDAFKLVSTPQAASYHDALYVQVPLGQDECDAVVYTLNVTENGIDKGALLKRGRGNCIETETRSLKIFEDQHDMFAKDLKGIVFVRSFTGNNISKDAVAYNPYVISQYNINPGQDRIEIHLPCYEATRYCHKLSEEGEVEDLNFYANQFVSERGVYPFALALYGVCDWLASSPGVRVDNTFIYYDSWRKSEAQDYNDWYLNLPGYDVRF